MIRSMKIYSLLISAAVFLSNSAAFACPTVDGIPDYNCDGEVIISILGDSLVKGFGDTKNNNVGGYVLRAQKKLPNVEILNLGELGLRTFELFDLIDEKFVADSRVIKSDYVILDLGRNDRWLFGTPAATYRNLKRASAQIKKAVTDITPDTPPLVITAVIMLPNRGSQGPWVKELDAIILRGSTDKAPNDLRFDLVSKRLLSTDQIHPTPKGYDALSTTFVKYLKKVLPKKVTKLHPDQDGDKLPDEFELKLFGTDPALRDTDGNGISDFAEIFN